MLSKKERIDRILVDTHVVSSLKEAQALVLAGRVIVDNQRIDKCSIRVDSISSVRIKNQKKWVSRGGDKLYSAVQELNLSNIFKDATVIDVGSSTGGFTDCALQLGAKTVIALDVGKCQLAWNLITDNRVISLERTDIREFKSQEYPNADIVLADISFNSLSHLSNRILNISHRPVVHFLLLVKPQFELKRNLVPQGGIIKNKEHQELALKNVISCFHDHVEGEVHTVKSQIRGRKGNQEYFIYFKINN